MTQGNFNSGLSDQCIITTEVIIQDLRCSFNTEIHALFKINNLKFGFVVSIKKIIAIKEVYMSKESKVFIRPVHHICATCWIKDKSRNKHSECSLECPHQLRETFSTNANAWA